VWSVGELLGNPVHETGVTIYGKVGSLGEVRCPCFELSSGGRTVWVWYDLMVEDDGTHRPRVNVEGIKNGDWVIVRGQLTPSEGQQSAHTFWASGIEALHDCYPME
jgi:hypothetical protein